ncbi:MAG: hydrolase [Gammaproteobacteria bacterium]
MARDCFNLTLVRKSKVDISCDNRWCADMEELTGGGSDDELPIYYFYTTCPKCQKYYGKNYVVGIAQTAR